MAISPAYSVQPSRSEWISEVPRVSVINWLRNPINPRDGMLKFHADAPGVVIHHLHHFAAPAAKRFHHDADE